MPLPPGLLPLAQELHTSVLRAIDHEIEIERMVSDARYARDVLLVCDACQGTELPALAAQWRSLTPRPPSVPTPPRLDDAPTSAPMDLPPMQTAWSAGSDFGPDANMARPTLPPVPAVPPVPEVPSARDANAGTTPGRWLQRCWARWRPGR